MADQVFPTKGNLLNVKKSLSLAKVGYELLDNGDYPAMVERQITAVNKARVSTGGIYLYTYEFNAKHTTGTTEPGVDVVCTIQSGSLALSGSLA